MGYTVHLFALDAPAFANKLRDQREPILARTRARAKREYELSAANLKHGLDLADRICRGDLPGTCSEDYFWALCWLAQAELERISLGVLISVKRFSYIEEIGLWPLVEKWEPLFRLPRSKKAPPGAGFVPREQIAGSAIPFLKGLPDNDADATYARQQVIEVLESLDEDRLDLLAIVVLS